MYLVDGYELIPEQLRTLTKYQTFIGTISLRKIVMNYDSPGVRFAVSQAKRMYPQRKVQNEAYDSRKTGRKKTTCPSPLFDPLKAQSEAIVLRVAQPVQPDKVWLGLSRPRTQSAKLTADSIGHDEKLELAFVGLASLVG